MGDRVMGDCGMWENSSGESMPAGAMRPRAIRRAAAYFDRGEFLKDLDRRVAIASCSQDPDRANELERYLADEMVPSLQRLGFSCEIFKSPAREGNASPSPPPFLIASRIEDPALPTVLGYGHGDVVRGQEGGWRDGLSPWKVTVDGDRLYGRGTADNKGQHTINLGALDAVLGERGRLGFNVKYLIETGEEVGSIGLHDFCRAHREDLAADFLLASDGPRLNPARPTIFTGSRGAINFDLKIDLREGGHHSGNWGGLLANPGTILANAIASLIDGRGRIRLEALKPRALPQSVRRALADCPLEASPGEASPGAPEIDEDWGEEGLTPTERVFGWNSFEVLAFVCGNPETPVNAIPPSARAHCQIRFTVDSDWRDFLPAIRRHLDENGFQKVTVQRTEMEVMEATRLDPDHPLLKWACASIERTTGAAPALLPNIGGSLPNDAFADILGLPTLWVPHSYRACSQHAPNEHMLASMAREGLEIMAGLYWDMGEEGFGREALNR